jgi:lipoyl(octanoyl) transferase
VTEQRWELLIDATGGRGADNMALDEALLVEADRSGRWFLRLYRWSPPCLSFGRHEPARSRYDRAAIARLALDVVRRPTGGRAVWHEHELTYAVAAPIAAFGSLRTTYHAIHARLATALRSLGAEASLAPDRPTAPLTSLGGGSSPACFAAPVGGEVLVGDRKVVGSAQVRRGGAFLQHGSILLAGSQDMVERVRRTPGTGNGSTTLSAALGRPIGFDEVADAIARTWGATGPPSAPLHLHPFQSAFADPEWTWRR